MPTHYHLRIAEYLAKSLDSQFQVGKFRFGLDPLIGLVPVAGDVFTTLVSLYIVWIGVQMKLPADKIAQMIGNVVFDFLLDFIPVLGQITDFAFKSNMRNLEILKQFAPEGVMEGRVVSG